MNAHSTMVGLAERVLEHYSLSVSSVRFNQHSGSRTFVVKDEAGGSYALRIHRSLSITSDPVWQCEAAVRSEMMWLDHLWQSLGTRAQKPIRNRDGDWVTVVEEQTGETAVCTLVSWIEGDCGERRLSDTEIKQAGQLLARLHREAEAWTPPANFTRPSYNGEYLRSRLAKASGLVEMGAVLAEDFAVISAVVKKILPLLASHQSDPLHCGLLHGDYHLANLVFHDGTILPIDFSECGYGAFMQDVAQFMAHIDPGRRPIFLDAYGSIRPLPKEARGVLEAFLIVHFVFWLAWISGIPERFEKAARFVPRIVRTDCRRFLAAEDFLFSGD